jgi:hypothetical protein
VIDIDLDALLSSLSTLIAVPLAWWLANKSRDRTDVKAERASLEAQFDAMLHAVIDLQTAAATNRILWESFLERLRSGVLVSLASLGGYGRTRGAGGSEWLSRAAALGAGAEMLSHERRDAKLAVASLKEPLSRVAAAGVPLARHPDPAISAATDRLIAAARDIDKNTSGLESALQEFGEAVRGALTPPRRRHRLLGRAQRSA